MQSDLAGRRTRYSAIPFASTPHERAEQQQRQRNRSDARQDGNGGCGGRLEVGVELSSRG
jgi:hypothetical protein